MKLKRKEINPFVVKIHFQVKLTDADLKRIQQSKNLHVQYYLAINPGFTDQYGVVVLVPVTFINIVYTLLKFLFKVVRKKCRS